MVQGLNLSFSAKGSLTALSAEPERFTGSAIKRRHLALRLAAAPDGRCHSGVERGGKGRATASAAAPGDVRLNVAGWPEAKQLEALGYQRCTKRSHALCHTDPHATLPSNNNGLLLSPNPSSLSSNHWPGAVTLFLQHFAILSRPIKLPYPI